MNDINDIFSYKSIRNSIHLFKSGVGSGEPEFMYDEPGYFFWKPIFYFYNGDSFSDGIGNGGLLYPSFTREFNNVEDTSNSNGGKALNKNKDAINDFIDKYIPQGGQIRNEWYWSSTVYNNTGFWTVGVGGGLSINYNYRYNSNRVRAVALAK